MKALASVSGVHLQDHQGSRGVVKWSYLLEATLANLKYCHVLCAAVVSNYKMKEVLMTLPTYLADSPPSEELASIRQHPSLLLFVIPVV